MAYGLQIKNASNNILLTSDTRNANFLVPPSTVTIPVNTYTGSLNTGVFGYSSYQSVPGMTTSLNDDIKVWIVNNSHPVPSSLYGFQNIHKVFLERGSGQFRLKGEVSGSANTSLVFSIKVMVFKF